VYYGDVPGSSRRQPRHRKNEITAFIGPSGCGKSTVLRCFDRMNDLIEIARVEGSIPTTASTCTAQRRPRRGPPPDRNGVPEAEPVPEVDLRQPRLRSADQRHEVEVRTRRHRRVVAASSAALWDEVKDRLKASAIGMSGGQQQRLCIARAIAVQPDVILMDEPCSSLDPIATGKIEELMDEIKEEYTIIIVTHNMQQAARVSDMTAFYSVEVNETSDTRTGILVEYDRTEKIFSNPSDERTERYVTGRFG
jgi:phosphate transport system ATP-binding protein